MTEKQRWLLRELDVWREQQFTKIGKYGPKRAEREPPMVRAARQAAKRAEKTISLWNAAKNEPWKKAQAAISKRCADVKRVILFEKTDAALKAIRGLK